MKESLKNVKVMENKGRLKNYSKIKETENV